MNVEAVLQELLDKQAIQELIARYSRTLDWLDDEGQAGCYWPDAAIDYGFFKGTAAEFVPVVMAVERSTGRRWHLLAPRSVKLTSATTAEGECYGVALGFRREGEEPYKGNMYGGRYLDTYEKREGEWRISSSLDSPSNTWTPQGRQGSKLRRARMMSMPLNFSFPFSSKSGVFMMASS